ncbi:unnamed protein product, partial [Amoebophrya sp. A25]|eukprot:GSA25T00024261001.1
MRYLLYLSCLAPCLVVARLAEVDEHGNTKVADEKTATKKSRRRRRRHGYGTPREMFQEAFLELVQSSSSEGVAQDHNQHYKAVRRHTPAESSDLDSYSTQSPDSVDIQSPSPDDHVDTHTQQQEEEDRTDVVVSSTFAEKKGNEMKVSAVYAHAQ